LTLVLFERDGGHGGQAHVEVRLVEHLMTDVLGTELLDGAEERLLVGYADDYARRDFVYV
jgi:hypothetical protein